MAKSISRKLEMDCSILKQTLPLGDKNDSPTVQLFVTPEASKSWLQDARLMAQETGSLTIILIEFAFFPYETDCAIKDIDSKFVNSLFPLQEVIPFRLVWSSTLGSVDCEFHQKTNSVICTKKGKNLVFRTQTSAIHNHTYRKNGEEENTILSVTKKVLFSF